ncbi:MAG TPA: Hsp33 family molecular chaperone HslO [Burkholderiaceae bacterium]|nr:Hsp33 family molecular chaperone HslO [Burkholderiaceae bacterium]
MDQLLKFSFAPNPIRGEIVQLRDVWQRMIRNHDYPSAVVSLLGQATAATALLASNLKFEGSLSLHIHGDGPLKLLVAECSSTLGLRATAKVEAGAHIEPNAELNALVNVHGGARCVLTLDTRNRLPYQGIVALSGNSIAQAIEAYMQTSEQLETRLWLSADAFTASGLLLQKLPQDGGRLGAFALPESDQDAWNRLAVLAGTLSPQEQLTMPPQEQVHKLFWQERISAGQVLRPRFECRCSRERVGRMLLTLGEAEIQSILQEQGSVTVTCDFCNGQQQFDAVDVGELFATGSNAGADSNRSQ